MVAAGSGGGRRRWRRGQGDSVNARWGRNIFTPPPLEGVKIGVDERDE
jgi:hypothetical protein